MKKEFKNVRIVAENGEALLLSQKRFNSLIQTLDLVASGAHRRQQQLLRSPNKALTIRN